MKIFEDGITKYITECLCESCRKWDRCDKMYLDTSIHMGLRNTIFSDFYWRCGRPNTTLCEECYNLTIERLEIRDYAINRVRKAKINKSHPNWRDLLMLEMNYRLITKTIKKQIS